MLREGTGASTKLNLVRFDATNNDFIENLITTQRATL